jgi:membrane-associated protease RseP (regulator of RpoE activity)
LPGLTYVIEFLQYPLALIVTLGVLVTFHELGHFLVARWSGVRVVRFSVGFGRPLVVVVRPPRHRIRHRDDPAGWLRPHAGRA